MEGKINLDIEKIKHLYQTKQKTLSEIGKEMGVSLGTIRHRMIDNGIPRRRGRPIINLDIEKIKYLYQTKRMTLVEIAKEMEVSSETILRRMEENNIPRRGAKRRLYNSKQFSNKQRKYLFGSLMGDDCLSRQVVTPYLQVLHSQKQSKYCEWKYNIWRDYTAKKPKKITIESGFDNGKEYEAIYFATRVHPNFNYFYDLFYGEKPKHINEEILNNVFSYPISLAIWYMDDGSYDNNEGRIIFSTHSFTLNENKLISKYFKQKLKIKSKVYPENRCKEIKYYIVLNKTEAKKFIEIISPYIIDSMKYKLGNSC